MNIIALAISLAHIFSNYFVKFKIWGVIKHLSSELPTLYIVSWVIIGWIGALLKINHKFLTRDFDNIFWLFVVVLLLSEVYVYFKNLWKNKNTARDYNTIEKKDL